MPLPSEGGPPGPHCGRVCCACQFRAATMPSVSVVGVGLCSSPADAHHCHKKRRPGMLRMPAQTPYCPKHLCGG